MSSWSKNAIRPLLQSNGAERGEAKRPRVLLALNVAAVLLSLGIAIWLAFVSRHLFVDWLAAREIPKVSGVPMHDTVILVLFALTLTFVAILLVFAARFLYYVVQLARVNLAGRNNKERDLTA